MFHWRALIGNLNSVVRDAFGREVQYVPVSTGVPLTIKAIFQATHQQDAKEIGNYAIAFVVTADLPSAPERGDQIVVAGVVYKVYEIEQDNQGGARLGLHQ